MSVHPSICSSACLFSSPSIHQSVHWFIVNPCLHLLTCLSIRPPAHPCTNHGPPSCQSSHTCILSPVHSLIHQLIHALSFFCQSFLQCACCSICLFLCLSISPVSVHLMSNLSVHCYYICLSDCLSIYH